MRKIFKLSVIILVLVTVLVGCSDNTVDIKDKTNAELTYIEDEIFTIVNKYAKDEYLKDGVVEWVNIQNDVKKIDGAIGTILLDLSELNISDEDILMFTRELSNLIIITSNQNERMMVDKLNYLYSLVPKYMASYEDNKNKVSKKELKSIILSSYNLSNVGNWEEAKTIIQYAEDKYKIMMNDIEYMKENSYNLNKIYILIEELKNAINTENINLVKLKYIKLIEEL